MKVKSEKQSSNVHEPSAEGGSSRLPFDPEKYRKYLAETGWSEKVQDEWLETLWNMMGTFVDLAWDTDPVQTVLKTKRPSSSEKLQPMAQRTSNPHNARKSLRKTRKRALLTDPQEVASPNIESSNQFFETLEEWNDYLEALQFPANGGGILTARRCRVSEGFPGSFGLYLDEPRRHSDDNHDNFRCIG